LQPAYIDWHFFPQVLASSVLKFGIAGAHARTQPEKNKIMMKINAFIAIRFQIIFLVYFILYL